MNWSDWIESVYDFLQQDTALEKHWITHFGNHCLTPLTSLIGCDSISLHDASNENLTLLWPLPSNAHGLAHNILIDLDDKNALKLRLARSKSMGPFCNNTRENISIMAQHLRRLIRLMEKLEHNLARQCLHDTIQDRWKTGIVTLNTQRELVYANPSAIEILNSHNDIELSGKGIHCKSRSSNATLKNALEIAIDAHIDGIPMEPLLLNLNLQQSELNMAITLPRSMESVTYWKDETACVIFIEDQNQPCTISPDYLKLRYKMTQRESLVAQEIMNGYSTGEIAKMHFVSEETVRKQAKSALKKAGAANHTELSRQLIESGHHVLPIQ